MVQEPLDEASTSRGLATRLERLRKRNAIAIEIAQLSILHSALMLKKLTLENEARNLDKTHDQTFRLQIEAIASELEEQRLLSSQFWKALNELR